MNVEAPLKSIAGLMMLVAVLSGCVSRQPVETPPAINLSPETMDFSPPVDDRRKDFGMTLSANESDSLDNLTVLPGVRVRSVVRGSAADQAGVRAGDVILSVFGTDTNEVDSLQALLQTEMQSGRNGGVDISARRGTTAYQTSLPVPEQTYTATPEELFRVDPLKTRAGYRTLMIDDRNGPRSRVQLVQLYPDSPLAAAGFAPGNLIDSIDGRQIHSAQALVNTLTQDYDYGDEVDIGYAESVDGPPIPTTRRVKLWRPQKHISKVQLWPLFTYESSLQPDSTRFTLLDLWVLSLFSYQRQGAEKTWSLFTLLKFSSDYGDLVEETHEVQ